MEEFCTFVKCAHYDTQSYQPFCFNFMEYDQSGCTSKL